MQAIRILFIFQLFIASHVFYAQEVIASSGEFQANSSGSFSWTLGEISTETISTSSVIFTQGFQQDYEHLLFLEEIPSNVNFTVYPNPFQQELIILSNEGHSNHLTALLYSLNGLLIGQYDLLPTISSEKISISIPNLPEGIYFLELKNSEQIRLKTFKLIKSI